MSARALSCGIVLGALSLGACTLAQDYPSVVDEICDNGVDDDLNGEIDCDDRACNAVAPCAPRFAWTDAGEPPIAPPSFPCPDGWRVVTADGVGTCDPYPEAGATDCPVGSAFFPGESACRPIGRACPTGTWPDDLPASNVWYVRVGFGGGDGTRASPFSDVGSAIAAASPTDGTVALAAGSYSIANLSQHVRIRGACVTGTHVAFQVSAGGTTSAITAGPVVLEDLSIDASQVGLTTAATTTLRGVRITGMQQFGVLASGALTLELDDVVVEHVSVGSQESYGIVAQAGASVRMQDVVIQDITGIGVAMLSGDATLAAQDVAIRDIHTVPMIGDGFGVEALVPTTLTRVVIERAGTAAIRLAAPATLTDIVVRDVASGAGIHATDQGAITGERVVIERAHEAGILVQSPASASWTDLVVRDTQADSMHGMFGRGIDVVGSSVDVRRAVIVRSAEHGVVSSDVARVHLEDVRIEGSAGGGIVSARSGAIDLSRGIVDGSALVGVAAIGRGATFVVEDLLVRDTAAAADGTLGYGLLVQDHAFAQADHVVVERSASIGALMLGARATLVSADLVVRGTGASTCGAACASGVGIGSFDGGELTVARFLVDDAPTCGLAVVMSGALETQAGAIRGAPIGSCVDRASGLGAALEASIAYLGSGVPFGPASGATPASVPLPAVIMAP